MTPKDIKITFIGMEPTEPLKEYCREKISKYKDLWKRATSIEVFLKENINRKGVKNNFRVDINVFLPKAKVRVEHIGEDMYKNIDKATDVLARRLKRYQDKKTFWEGKESWKILEAQKSIQEIEDDEEVEDYYAYIPQIATRKQITDTSPIEEGEAIERMELSGYNQLLFTSRKSGKLSMVYKREQGGYGLVEPK
ncbi:ribosome-associated translation inhibitor RaiA [bacterium]|nr:ribosome-associated translation inhibitor RaiA [bacterium]